MLPAAKNARLIFNLIYKINIRIKLEQVVVHKINMIILFFLNKENVLSLLFMRQEISQWCFWLYFIYVTARLVSGKQDYWKLGPGFDFQVRQNVIAAGTIQTRFPRTWQRATKLTCGDFQSVEVWLPSTPPLLSSLSQFYCVRLPV